MTTKKTNAKKPAKKNNSSKAALDKAAADLRKLKAEAKKTPAKKSPATKKSAPPKGDPGALEVLAPVKPSERPIDEIMRERVIVADDFSSLKLDDATPLNEFLPVFDHFGELGRRYQFVIGDLYNEGFRIYGETFAHQMAASGRPVSTLKKWGSISANVPVNLRNLHPKLEWSHCAETAKLADKPKEQKEVLTEAAKEAKAGKVPSVRVIRERVAKIKPKRKLGPKRVAKAKKTTTEPKREPTVEERNVLIDLEDAAARLESLIGGASFITELEGEYTLTLREKLGAAARLVAKLE